MKASRLLPSALLLLLALLGLGACTPAPVTDAPASTIAPTLTASLVPSTATLAPSTTPTPWRTTGTLSTQVYLRAGPGTTYAALALLPAGATVDILAQAADGSWLQVLHAEGEGGVGWVAAQFVQGAAQGIPTLTPAWTPTPAGPAARVTQRLNVRAGPGASYDSLGVLEPGTILPATGTNASGAWVQVVFAASPAGLGWVSAAYVQLENAAALPRLDDLGTPLPGDALSTGLPLTPAPSPTPTPALEDGDSALAPGARVTFTHAGTRRFVSIGAVSAPQGDGEDWIEFTPYSLPGSETAWMTASLACQGGALRVELWHAGSQLAAMQALSCGSAPLHFPLALTGPYQVRLVALPGSAWQVISYELSLRNDP